MSRTQSHYLPTLDGWRAIAICLVLFCHASVGVGLERFKDVGLLGVQIFFGLSGFLITTLLLGREARSGAVSLSDFYTRRVFRIVPAALLYLITVGLLANVLDITFPRWISTLLFMANYSTAPNSWYVGHFWSLAVEEHFYLIWPVTLLLLRGNRKRLIAAVCAALLVALWRAGDFKYHFTWTNAAWFWGRTDINADGIIFGVISALALADDQIGPAVTRILSRPFVAPLAIGVILLTSVTPPHSDWKIGFLLITVRAATIPVMIVATLKNPSGLLGRTLELRPLRFLGLISYSLYLWQQLFLTWEPNPTLSPIQWFPLNLAVAVFCAVVSFYAVETPMIRLGHRLNSKRLEPASKQTAMAGTKMVRISVHSTE